jgi:hypothetical protein
MSGVSSDVVTASLTTVTRSFLMSQGMNEMGRVL